MRSALVILMTCLAGVVHPQIPANQETGSISGQILDEQGNPKGDVMIFIEGTSPSSTYRLRAKTDDSGQFRAAPLKFGSYVIYPFKEEELYMLPGSTFVTLTPERAELSRQAKDVEVLLRLLPPGGWLLLKVRSATTRQPIVGASIMLCHTDDVTRAAQTKSDPPDGELKYLIPSSTDISALVEAEGFQAVQIPHLIVAPRGTKEVVVNLLPVSSGAMSYLNPEAVCHFHFRLQHPR
jgi:hypothetical protein